MIEDERAGPAKLMDRALPGCPRLYFGVVDVRNTADLILNGNGEDAKCPSVRLYE